MAGSKSGKTAVLPSRPASDKQASTSRRPASSRTSPYHGEKPHSNRKSQRSAALSAESSFEALRSHHAEPSTRAHPSGSRAHTPPYSPSMSRAPLSESDSEDDEPAERPQLTEGSIAALLRLESRFQDMENMVALMMDFQRYCGGTVASCHRTDAYLADSCRCEGG